MFTFLQKHARSSEYLMLGGLTLFCLGCSLFRYYYSDTRVFLFLNWNLFLAIIPWLLSTLMVIKPALQRFKRVTLLIMVVWLLFFPNAPYILTDLFHLRLRSSMPVWFDLILILSFAWTGLMFGLLSLWDIEQVLQQQVKRKWIRLVPVVLLFLSAFGIYIGRYLRWNSWDVVSEPLGLMYDVGHRVAFPLDHPRTWGMTLLMGAFLNLIYYSFRVMKSRTA